MIKAVLNEQNIVENIIIAPDGFHIEGKILVDGVGSNIGDTYEKGVFVKPPEEQPAEGVQSA